MPVYIDYQKYESNRATGDGLLLPLAGDQSGNTYIRQSHFPSGQFTYSNHPTKYPPSEVVVVGASGVVYVTPLYLPGGFVVQNLQYVLGTTTASALTHRWACLFNSAKVLVASTADDTTAVPTVSTIISAPIATASGAAATAYKVPSSLAAGHTEGEAQLYWFGLMMAGTTMPTAAGTIGNLGANGTAPATGPTDLTGKTTVLLTDGTVAFTSITAGSTASGVPWVGAS